MPCEVNISLCLPRWPGATPPMWCPHWLSHCVMQGLSCIFSKIIQFPHLLILCQKRRFLCYFSTFLLLSQFSQANFKFSTNWFLRLQVWVMDSMPWKSQSKILKTPCARVACSAATRLFYRPFWHSSIEKRGLTLRILHFSSFEPAHMPLLWRISPPHFLLQIFIFTFLYKLWSVFDAVCAISPHFSASTR